MVLQQKSSWIPVRPRRSLWIIGGPGRQSTLLSLYKEGSNMSKTSNSWHPHHIRTDLICEHGTPGEKSPTETPLPQEAREGWTLLLTNFYRTTKDLILCLSVTVWYGSSTVQDSKDLARVVRTLQWILGDPLPDLDSLYRSRGKLIRLLQIPPILAMDFLYLSPHRKGSETSDLQPRLRDSFLFRAVKSIKINQTVTFESNIKPLVTESRRGLNRRPTCRD